MAQQASVSPFKTQRFSFIGSELQRDGVSLKDQRFVNAYPEMITTQITGGKKYFLKKRPGLSSLRTLSGSNARGLYYWNNITFCCIGNTLWADGTSIITLVGVSGKVGFCEFRTDSENVLIFCDGTNGYAIAQNLTVTQITQFPTPHIPSPQFIDGYVVVAGAGTQNVYNSDLEDYNTWDTGEDVIAAEMYADNLVWLTSSVNYIVAIGTHSIEFFYDQANSTGSPLGRNAPAVQQYGTCAPWAVATVANVIIVPGTTATGGRTIWIIDTFKSTQIAPEPIREALDAEQDDIGLATGYVLETSGHRFYVINLKRNHRTFVYDFEEQMWHEWSTNGLGEFEGDYVCDSAIGLPVVLSSISPNLYYVDSDVFDDHGTGIICDIVTAKLDMDTMKRKRIVQLTLVGDAPNGITGTSLNLTWSDDDYNTYTADRNISLGAIYPTDRQHGITRRRAYRFVYNQPYDFRMEGFELDFTIEERK